MSTIIPFILATALLSAPTPETKTRVVIYDLRSSEELKSQARKVTDELLVQAGKRPGYAVIGEREIEVMLSHAEDRDRLLDCEGSEACLSKLSGVADAEKIITGHFARWGSGYLITLSISDAKQSAVERGESINAEDESELIPRARELVDRLLGGPVTNAPKFRMTIAPSGTKAAVLNLVADGEDNNRIATSLTELLALELKKYDGLSVISRDEIAAMLEYEANKQFVQCKSDIACIIEIGGALGVDYLVSGSVGKLDDTFVITLKLMVVKQAEVSNRVAESFRGPESSLGQALRIATSHLLGRSIEGRGSLSITSAVEGARASVDGGRTFALAEDSPLGLTAGKHALSFFAEGHSNLLLDAYVEEGQVTKVDAQLLVLPSSWYEKWWVWTIIGVAAAAGVTTSVVIANRGADDTTVNVSVAGQR